jgi:hypothetical protein
MFIIDQALLFRLLIGHVIADFLLQPRSMVIKKNAKTWRSRALYIHAVIYSAVVTISASTWKQSFWLLPALFLSHALIDGWKASRGDRASTFIGDQLAHLAVLAVSFYFLAESAPEQLKTVPQKIWQSPRLLAIVLGYLLVLWPVGRLMNVLTDRFRRQLDDEKSRGLELAGLWIGYLERLFLVTLILLDYLPGIALLLGLKSLFRFGEIKDPANRKEAEYILIGTLLSFGFALAAGMIVKTLIKTLS